MRVLPYVIAATALFVSLAASPQMPDAKVKVKGPASAKAGGTARLTVTLEIPKGHHAYAPPASGSQLVVNVSAPAKSAYKITKVTYPKGVLKAYPGLGDEKVRSYEGVVKIPVDVALPKGARRAIAVTLDVRTQLCTNDSGQCFPPKTATVTVAVPIK